MHSEHDETTTESVDSDPESDNEEKKSTAEDNNSEMEENVSNSDTENMFEKYTFCKTCNKNCAQNSNLKKHIENIHPNCDQKRKVPNTDDKRQNKALKVEHQCEQFKKNFSYNYNLKRHTQSHS